MIREKLVVIGAAEAKGKANRLVSELARARAHLDRVNRYLKEAIHRASRRRG